MLQQSVDLLHVFRLILFNESNSLLNKTGFIDNIVKYPGVPNKLAMTVHSDLYMFQRNGRYSHIFIFHILPESHQSSEK